MAKRLRETLGFKPVRLIALTGYGQANDPVQTHEVGFHHHLTKPVDVAGILELLETSYAIGTLSIRESQV